MATKTDVSKALPVRSHAAVKSRSSSSPVKPERAASSLGHLEDIIEDERARLMKAHSILSCVVIAMEASEICAGNGPYWPSVIESARDLIDESIRKLEGLDYEARSVAEPSNGVKESLVTGYRAWATETPLPRDDSGDGVERVDSSAAERVAMLELRLVKGRRLN